jgi:hypothetical protein
MIADVAAARARAELARARLTQDMALLKERASPATLMADAKEQAVSTVTGKPAVTAGIAAALLAFAAIPPVRRAGMKLAAFGWRNRAALGLLLGARLRGGPSAERKKDEIR